MAFRPVSWPWNTRLSFSSHSYILHLRASISYWAVRWYPVPLRRTTCSSDFHGPSSSATSFKNFFGILLTNVLSIWPPYINLLTEFYLTRSKSWHSLYCSLLRHILQKRLIFFLSFILSFLIWPLSTSSLQIERVIVAPDRTQWHTHTHTP
jgi:hypothetical protein